MADERLTTIGSLLEHTDATLRAGAPAGARVWPTGFDLIDEALTGGLRSGELALLGGAHGQGKTTIAVQAARNTVAAGGAAVVFSYEHEAHTLLERLIALEAAEAAGDEAVSVTTIRRMLETVTEGVSLADLLGQVRGGSAALDALTSYGDRLLIHESSGVTTTLVEIERIIRRVGDQVGQVPLTVVDYLQKIPMPHEPDEGRRVTAVTEGLKDLALDVGAPILSISAADKDSLVVGRRMRTADLRGSSALAYEADVVILVSNKHDVVARDHLVYNLGNIERFQQWAVVSLEKNRHGRGGVELEYAKDFEHGRFHTDGGYVTERLVEERVFTS